MRFVLCLIALMVFCMIAGAAEKAPAAKAVAAAPCGPNGCPIRSRSLSLHIESHGAWAFDGHRVSGVFSRVRGFVHDAAFRAFHFVSAVRHNISGVFVNRPRLVSMTRHVVFVRRR